MEAGGEGGGCVNTSAGGRSPFLVPTIQQRVQPIKVKKQPASRAVSSMPPHARDRYKAAHATHFQREYPSAWKDGHYFEPDIPKCNDANSLTLFITKFLNFLGHRATRINVQGQLIDGVEKQDSGVEIVVKKWRTSSTRKGTADISATIYGRACQLEIKFGKDRPSPAQLKEQAKERKAGGVYEFIKDVESFLSWYDGFILSISKQTSIFD